ncbi:MAG: hypothetical protein KAG66_14720, partial [Methylococcales bacterium]|nr:hypothetical protein [Methylococcales bacterium]
MNVRQGLRKLTRKLKIKRINRADVTPGSPEEALDIAQVNILGEMLTTNRKIARRLKNGVISRGGGGSSGPSVVGTAATVASAAASTVGAAFKIHPAVGALFMGAATLAISSMGNNAMADDFDSSGNLYRGPGGKWLPRGYNSQNKPKPLTRTQQRFEDAYKKKYGSGSPGNPSFSSSVSSGGADKPTGFVGPMPQSPGGGAASETPSGPVPYDNPNWPYHSKGEQQAAIVKSRQGTIRGRNDHGDGGGSVGPHSVGSLLKASKDQVAKRTGSNIGSIGDITNDKWATPEVTLRSIRAVDRAARLTGLPRRLLRNVAYVES